MAQVIIGNCKDCLHYEAGFDGKPGVCTNLLVADTWSTYDNLKKDGVGYSDELWSRETAELFVGEYFGCIHFDDKK